MIMSCFITECCDRTAIDGINKVDKINISDGSKISPTFTDSIGSQSSPLSISVSGRGNDIFLHWMSNCKGHDKETLKYSFAEGEHIHDKV